MIVDKKDIEAETGIWNANCCSDLQEAEKAALRFSLETDAFLDFHFRGRIYRAYGIVSRIVDLTTIKPIGNQTSANAAEAQKIVDAHGNSGKKYIRTIYDINGANPIEIDIYCVIDSFEVKNPGLQHAIKKLLCAGLRKKADFDQDLGEAIVAIKRGITISKHGAKDATE